MNLITFLRVLGFFLLMVFSPDLDAKKNEVDAFLEQNLSESHSIKTRQIKIPGYPNAYNPSMVSYKDGYLLSFRWISRCPEKLRAHFRTDVSFIGLVKLDKNWKVLEKTVQMLNVQSHSPQFSLTAEDARLLKVGERIFIFFNDFPPSRTSDGFAMYFGELVEDRGIFSLQEPAKALYYASANQVEKNWSPFSVEDKVYTIYSDQPRIILEVDLNTGYCHEVSRTESNVDWDFGQIRGGTPAYQVGDVLLTFFHSSFPAQTSKKRAYVMGAYTFEKTPPFAIRAITSRPLGDLSYYTQENASKIIFPTGMVLEDRWIHVTWGKADKRIFITTFDREKFLQSLNLSLL